MSSSRSWRGDVASLHERALLLAAQRADRRALEELLRRYEPLALAIAARLRLPVGCDRHDIAQEARLGVLAAIRMWRPERGSFRALAVRCARTRALKAIDAAGARKHRLLSQAVPLDDAPASGRAGQRHQPAILVYEGYAAGSADRDPVAILLTREQLGEIRAALPTLTARERIALAGVLNDRTHRQLAVEHDTTRKAIASAVGRARTKLATGDALAA
jgi:RNA polymerase sigma factor (sigma-70 family)